jgi:hypothetical protein
MTQGPLQWIPKWLNVDIKFRETTEVIINLHSGIVEWKNAQNFCDTYFFVIEYTHHFSYTLPKLLFSRPILYSITHSFSLAVKVYSFSWTPHLLLPKLKIYRLQDFLQLTLKYCSTSDICDGVIDCLNDLSVTRGNSEEPTSTDSRFTVKKINHWDQYRKTWSFHQREKKKVRSHSLFRIFCDPTADQCVNCHHSPWFIFCYRTSFLLTSTSVVSVKQSFSLLAPFFRKYE